MNLIVTITIILLALLIYFIVNKFSTTNETNKILDIKKDNQDDIDIQLSDEVKKHIEINEVESTQKPNITEKVALIFFLFIAFALCYYYFINTKIKVLILLSGLLLILFSFIHLVSVGDKNAVKLKDYLYKITNRILYKIGFGENLLNSDNFIVIFPIVSGIFTVCFLFFKLIVVLLNLWYVIVIFSFFYFLYKLWSSSKFPISKSLLTIGLILILIYLYEFRSVFKFLLKNTGIDE